ncbi:hypothetical protein VRU48_14955 [Pedobacter sp. KR3-3]|uniref:Secreted protein n=1 Tax=Pedobacter albus TaxID=3113905 RepID=A0ABU7IAW4_9SPHI|nr:hypothetical protein [Pedobacter sp. KR3-3]MEE1946421.1 hypothetical protein [Pedobacter sp. KR3-3]
MKKTIFVALFLFSTGLVNATVYYTTKDCQRAGYDRVEESHFTGGANLTCTRAGSTQCKYKDGHVPPRVIENYGNIDEIVSANVNEGVLSGSADFEGGYYTWNATKDGEIQFSIVTTE